MSPPTPTLGSHINRRRLELILSQSEAARRAGVSRVVWIAWEKGEAIPRDSNWGKIERALLWQAGSVAAVLDGGQPTPLPLDEPAPKDGPPPDDEFVRTVRAMNIRDSWKDALIKEYWAEKRQHDAQLVEKYTRLAKASGED